MHERNKGASDVAEERRDFLLPQPLFGGDTLFPVEASHTLLFPSKQTEHVHIKHNGLKMINKRPTKYRIILQ